MISVQIENYRRKAFFPPSSSTSNVERPTSRRQLCLSNLSPAATKLKSKDQLSCADEFSSDDLTWLQRLCENLDNLSLFVFILWQRVCVSAKERE